jgi:hypothetical protein
MSDSWLSVGGRSRAGGGELYTYIDTYIHTHIIVVVVVIVVVVIIVV